MGLSPSRVSVASEQFAATSFSGEFLPAEKELNWEVGSEVMVMTEEKNSPMNTRHSKSTADYGGDIAGVT